MPTTVAMTQYSANGVLAQLLNNATAVPGVAGGLYLWLLKTAPTTDQDQGLGVAFIATTYTKPQVPFTIPALTGQTYQRAYNTSAFSITMSGTTDDAVGIALCANGTSTPTAADFTTTPGTNRVYFYGTFSAPITLNATDVLQFAIGSAAGTQGITIDLY